MRGVTIDYFLFALLYNWVKPHVLFFSHGLYEKAIFIKDHQANTFTGMEFIPKGSFHLSKVHMVQCEL